MRSEVSEVAGDVAAGRHVADVMLSFPRTHGPGTTLTEIRELFRDDHVHMALIVTIGGLLLTTIERTDLAVGLPPDTPARELGTLAGRTAGPANPLGVTTAALLRGRRRRLAIVDECGQLLGLLCLQKDGAGYCSDEGVQARQAERLAPRELPGRVALRA
jgi:hypothetical protein